MRLSAPLLAFSLLTSSLPARAGTGPGLSLEAYLRQVKQTNGTYQGALGSGQASTERSQAAHELTDPLFFSNATLGSDAKLPQLPFFIYDRVLAQDFNLGVSKEFDFGLQAKLSYELTYTSFVNPGGIPTGGIATTYYDAAPKLELSLPLWGGGFGRATRARKTAILSQGQAALHSGRFQASTLLNQAELAYYRLAIARETYEIEGAAVEDARKILEWNERRARQHLGEESDVLQARAGLDARALELQTARDVLRSASRDFNDVRNVDSDDVPEKLEPVDSRALLAQEPPARAGHREDTRAAESSMLATQASADVDRESALPSLSLFGSYAANGRSPELGIPTAGTVGGALSDSYAAGRPTAAVGIKFSTPLDFSVTADVRQGAAREREAQEALYRQKLLDEQHAWRDLVRRLGDAKQRVELSRGLERTQSDKLALERKRLTQGRTLTYQVLLFEEDYMNAQLSRLRSELDTLGILTQMKLYSGEEP